MTPANVVLVLVVWMLAGLAVALILGQCFHDDDDR